MPYGDGNSRVVMATKSPNWVTLWPSVMVLAQWTVHPAKQRPRDVILVIAVLLLSTGAVSASLQSLFLTALAAVFLMVSVASFVFPTHYRVTDEGVSEQRLWRRRRRRWCDLRRIHVGCRGVLVSPFARPHWLDRYRGIVLVFDPAVAGDSSNGQRERLLAILRDHIPSAAAGTGHSGKVASHMTS